MIDYFKDLNSVDQILSADIKIKEEIHDIIPKYEQPFSPFASLSEMWNDTRDRHGTMKEMRLKQEFNRIGMFCFVSWNWVNPLAEFIGDKKCLEVMAGRGWLSYALQQKGVDIKATDNFSWHEMPEFITWNDTVTDVEKIDAVEAVEKYGKDIDYLFMMWAYMDNTAYQVIKKLHEVNPEALVIFCGEGHGGCTANDDFYEHFEEIDDDYFYNNVASKYDTWFGLHDRLSIGKYSEENIYGDEET